MADATVWGGVVVAAGRSERFGGIDKTLLNLDGHSVLARSLDALISDPRIRAVALVSSEANQAACRELAHQARASLNVVVCSGGDTRSASVRAGIEALPPDVTHVAIHDAARPLVPPEVVASVLDAAEEHGAAVPVVPVTSTLLVAGDGDRVAGTLDRATARESQTPQAGRRSDLIAALERGPQETDEATALYNAGFVVRMVAGSRRNLKLTVADDLRVARGLLRGADEGG